MAIRVKLKNSVVANKAPLPTDLEIGEVAINANAASPAAYIKDTAGNVVKLAGSGAIGGTPATETAAGIVELATAAETVAGADATRAVTPAGLKSALAAQVGSSTAPASPTAGQVWVNSSVTPSVVNVWNGTAWVPQVGATITSATAPATPATGQVWIDTSVNPNAIKIWDGTRWVTAAPDGSAAAAIANDAKYATKAELQAEDLWDRTGTTLRTKTAGDKVDAAALPAATTTVAGAVQLADAAAVTAGTAGRVVDAALLKAAVAAEELWGRTGTEITTKTAGDSVFTSGPVKVGGTTAAPNVQIKADGGIVANTQGLVYDAATKRLGIGITPAAYGENSRVTLRGSGFANAIYTKFDGTGNDKHILLANGNGALGYLGTNSGVFTLGDSSTEVVNITGGYLRMATSTGGIQFNGDTAAANALDDYEEGTFTPTIVGQTTAGAASYSTQLGRYTKIGRTVFVELMVVWTSGTGTGNLTINGLPFASANIATHPALSCSYFTDLTLPTGAYLVGQINQNATSVVLMQLPTGGGISGGGLAYNAAATVLLSGTYTI